MVTLVDVLRGVVVFAIVGVGCGDNRIPAPDAPTLAHVAITITGENLPVPGVLVYFQNADSSLVAGKLTDVNGDASADMAPGGSVTALAAGDVYTYLGIDSDEHLRLAIAPQPTSSPINITVTVPVDDAAWSYQLHTSCGTAFLLDESMVPVRLVNCGAAVDMLVVTYGYDGQTPIHQIYRPNVAIAEGATIVFDEPYTPVGQAVLVVNGSPDIGSLGSPLPLLRVLESQRGVLGEMPRNPIRGGIVYDPIVRNSTMVTKWVVGYEHQRLFDWRPQAATYNFDLTNKGLQQYYYAPTFDPQSYALTWSGPVQSAAVETASFLQLQIFNGAFFLWTWNVITPRDGASIPLPHLPDPSFTIAPDQCVRNARIVNLQLSGNYDSILANALPFAPPESPDVPPDTLPSALMSGSAGWIVLEEFVPNIHTRTPNCPPP